MPLGTQEVLWQQQQCRSHVNESNLLALQQLIVRLRPGMDYSKAGALSYAAYNYGQGHYGSGNYISSYFSPMCQGYPDPS